MLSTRQAAVVSFNTCGKMQILFYGPKGHG